MIVCEYVYVIARFCVGVCVFLFVCAFAYERVSVLVCLCVFVLMS